MHTHQWVWQGNAAGTPFCVKVCEENEARHVHFPVTRLSGPSNGTYSHQRYVPTANGTSDLITQITRPHIPTRTSSAIGRRQEDGPLCMQRKQEGVIWLDKGGKYAKEGLIETNYESHMYIYTFTCLQIHV